MFNLEFFINKHVIHRDISMFKMDMASHISELREAIEGKSVLVIGGAGSIGSSFIREILSFHIAELYIVDINENTLTELTRDLRSGEIPGVMQPVLFTLYFRRHATCLFHPLLQNRRTVFCSRKARHRSPF